MSKITPIPQELEETRMDIISCRPQPQITRPIKESEESKAEEEKNNEDQSLK